MCMWINGADFEMAEMICVNVLFQRSDVCNAMETLLVYEKTAPIVFPQASNFADTRNPAEFFPCGLAGGMSEFDTGY